MHIFSIIYYAQHWLYKEFVQFTALFVLYFIFSISSNFFYSLSQAQKLFFDIFHNLCTKIIFFWFKKHEKRRAQRMSNSDHALLTTENNLNTFKTFFLLLFLIFVHNNVLLSIWMYYIGLIDGVVSCVSVD